MKTLLALPILMFFIQIASFAQVSADSKNPLSDDNSIGAYIFGDTVVCDFVMNGALKYGVNEIEGVSNYYWTAPEGVSIIEGQGTNSIMVQINENFTGGELKLIGNGSGKTVRLSMPMNLLPLKPQFSKSTSAVMTNQKLIFSVEDHGETFTWDLPKGAEIVSGMGSSEITVKFGKEFKGGNVTVYANNNCGLAVSNQLYVGLESAMPSDLENSVKELAQK
jgi:hypothetical protein